MRLPLNFYDADIKQEADRTFTASLAPWRDEPITGIPTLDLARRFLHAAHEAIGECARNAMVED